MGTETTEAAKATDAKEVADMAEVAEMAEAAEMTEVAEATEAAETFTNLIAWRTQSTERYICTSSGETTVRRLRRDSDH